MVTVYQFEDRKMVQQLDFDWKIIYFDETYLWNFIKHVGGGEMHAFALLLLWFLLSLNVKSYFACKLIAIRTSILCQLISEALKAIYLRKIDSENSK